uniref:Beta-1,4-N-acetylgalactosaminyltransferase n=1 Tax=Echeneis naucrates TaxID=173247 RepID=A0A665VJ07_ECHNA
MLLCELSETDLYLGHVYSQEEVWIVGTGQLLKTALFSLDCQVLSKEHHLPPLFLQYEGQANLHVFEDWCGGSTAELRKNLHYPLYPHSRTTVKKLAVSPRWTNYGLRIFGYLHPYTDGEFVFALSSEDNSELWLSTDESPLNLQLLAWVGKTGTEWTAPGEFDKYVSQSSRSVRLSSQRRYFFEVIHKQNNKGTDHVEVAVSSWTFLFSCPISYVPSLVYETNLLMSDVSHIPQTAASHLHTAARQPSSAADMLREDPRDNLYKVPLIKSKYLHGVLPDCSYKPSYTIKDFPLMRYQGLQFIHMSYIYPNDYTRLTNMESENSCFYARSTHYMEMFGFSRYMRLDLPERQEKGNIDNGMSNFGFRGKEPDLYEEEDFDNKAYQPDMDAKLDQMDNALFPDYGDDYDDYVQKRRRKLLMQETNKSSFDTKLRIDKLQWRQQMSNNSMLQPQPEKQDESQLSQATQVSVRHQQTNQTELKLEGPVKKVEQGKSKLKRPTYKRKVKLLKTVKQTNPLRPDDREPLKAKEEPKPPAEHLSYKQNLIKSSPKMNQTQTHIINDSKLQPLRWNTTLTKTPRVVKQRTTATKEAKLQPGTNKQFSTPKRDFNRPVAKLNQRDIDTRNHLKGKQMKMNKPPQQDLEHGIHRDEIRDKVDKWGSDRKGAEDNRNKEANEEAHKKTQKRRDTWMGEQYYLWGAGGDFDVAGEEPPTPAPVFDPEVVWSQTFQVDNLNLQSRRSDLIDLSCNVSGNLLLHSSDALSIVKAFMEQLNKKHQGRFTLDRVVNVVKRLDGVQGSRYLLELELKDVNGQLVRLSQYIYTLIRHSRQRRRDSSFEKAKPELVLCNPVGFRWNPFATVHFVVPVKNQARWVQQLIADMEKLFRETGDDNFNLIIADYNSTDMDVRKALQKSSLPRYQYVKLSGNFERSAGLQAGINLINDDHSIVFLCDLHIDFPSFMIDTIRKHCVEGYMAFAPIVMRLDCGSPPSEARGYWEVNGFGLLAIYKSDLDAVGGMNTKEFTDRWGGEDWELLDRLVLFAVFSFSLNCIHTQLSLSWVNLT